jgi:hypothetical protein
MRCTGLLGAMVIGSLASCNTQRSGVERPVIQAAEPAPLIATERASAALGPQAAQKIALSISRHPEPFLAMRGASGIASLRAQAGKSVSFNLAVPGIARWADANVARFVVRLPDGAMETVPFDSAASRGLVTYTFAAAGPAMLMFCAGPKAEPTGDSFANVTHCSKIVVRVSDGGKPVDVGDDFTGETGLPLDVVPLVSPVRLTVGSELPVSFHYMNEEQGGIAVAALRPDGSVDHQLTSESGVAHFQITQPGRWVVRFAKEHPQGDRVGELVFGIPEKNK